MRWTHARITEFQVLWATDLSYEQIAAHMGITVGATVSARYKFNLPPRKRGRKLGVPNKVITEARQPTVMRERPVMPSSIAWPTREQLMARR